MEIDGIKGKLENTLSQKRYIHSLGVMETAVGLAKKYGADAGSAALAGILHDCARDIKGGELVVKCEKYGVKPDKIMAHAPELIHSILGAVIAKEEYGVEDEDILKSIRFHTTGCAGMSLLNKIILIADFIEPGRKFDGVEKARELAFKNIDDALLYSLDSTIRHIIEKDCLLHTDTVDARNYVLLTRMKFKH